MTDQPGGGSSELMSERMQSLLSRAAEDQASEQRQIQALLTEVRGLLARLPDDVAGAASRATDPNLVSHVNQLGQQVAYLGQRLDAIAQAISGRGQDDAASLAVVGAVQSATEGVLARIEALGQQVQELAARPQAAAAGGQALAEVAGRVGGVERNMAELGAAVAEIHRRVSALDNGMGPLAAEVRTLSERIDARIGNRLDRLDEIATAVQQPATAPSDSAVTEQLGELRAAVESLLARPSLAEDRETVVLAVRQFLGETVKATVAESERNVREHVNASLTGALPASEARIRGEVEKMLRALASELDQRLDNAMRAAVTAEDQKVREQLIEALHLSAAESEQRTQEQLTGLINASAEAREQQLREDLADALESTRAATEQRLMEHVDDAVFALAELLVRRKGTPGGARRRPVEQPSAPAVESAGETAADSPVETAADSPAETAADSPAETAVEAPSAPPAEAVGAPTVSAEPPADEAASGAGEESPFLGVVLEPALGSADRGDADEASAAESGADESEAAETAPDQGGRRKRGWWRSGE